MTSNISSPTANPFDGQTFLNIDEKKWLDHQLSALARSDAKNFAVGFDASYARCQVNLQPDELATVFEADNEDAQVRWVSFWGWDMNHRSVFDKIARKYKISPRLVGLIWPGLSGPVDPRPSPSSTGNLPQSPSLASHKPGDLEAGTSKRERLRYYLGRERPKQQLTKKSGFGNIAENIWHFCSVDFGARYVHIGFNQLFMPALPGDHPALNNPNKPLGVRLWTSILLCEDGTVISVFEPPPQSLRGDTEVLKTLRRNVLNVFSHLSRQHVWNPEDTLHKISVRPQSLPVINISSTPNAAEKIRSARNGMASLLFYYLFDDWFTSYALISGGQQPYRAKLEAIRNNMFHTADIESVHSLHEVGRQLGILKLMYKSYELIVNRLIESQQLRDDASTQRTSRLKYLEPAVTVDDMLADALLTEASSQDSRIKLSNACIFRFERLLDRIRLYALTEIEDCLKEKDELVFMNFNLVSLNESQAVEKLTRTTILLAKVTVMFLPISLMTSYFGISIGDIENLYTIKTYWLSFLVVVVVTLGFLISFGLVSYKISDGLGYTSFAKWLWDRSRNKRERSKLEETDNDSYQ